MLKKQPSTPMPTIGQTWLVVMSVHTNGIANDVSRNAPLPVRNVVTSGGSPPASRRVASTKSAKAVPAPIA